jgi:DnaJ-domain-containing protein 1
MWWVSGLIEIVTQQGRDFLVWFEDLDNMIKSVALFGVFMLARGLLEQWTKKRRQRRLAEKEHARWQEAQWREQQHEAGEQQEKRRTYAREDKRRREQYARDREEPGGHDQQGHSGESDHGYERSHQESTQGQTRQENVGEPRSWWEVLGISHDSSLDEAKAAYYSKVKQYHPDKVVGLGEEFRQLAERKTQELNAAFHEVRRNLGR